MNPELKRRRLVAITALAVAAVAFGFLAFGNIGDNLVYYWSPSELLAAGNKAYGASIRLGGLVAPGSIVRDSDGLTLHFDVIDDKERVPVFAKTVPPAMFREKQGVVVEGTLGRDNVFQSTRLLVKHDNEYRAPDAEDNRSIEELMKSMQFETDT